MNINPADPDQISFARIFGKIFAGIRTGNTRRPWKRGGKVIHSGGQIVKALDQSTLAPHIRTELKRTGRRYITRNSRCPCGSGKRFKRCCYQEPKRSKHYERVGA